MSLEDYIKGERYGKSAHELEKEALRDPFLQDAIDGYDLEDGYPANNLKKLNKQIKKITKKRIPFIQLLGIIICTLIIIGITVFFFIYDNSKEELPYVNNHENPLTLDSLLELRKQTISGTTPAQVDSNDTIEGITTPDQPENLTMTQEKTAVVQQQDRKLNSVIGQNTRARVSDELNSYALSTRDVQEILSTYTIPEEKPVSNIEQTPKPVIGDNAYNDYIKNNQKTVVADADENQHGKVILIFKVNENGRPVDISVLRSLNQAADREAVRLLQNGPNWTVSNKNSYLEVDF